MIAGIVVAFYTLIIIGVLARVSIEWVRDMRSKKIKPIDVKQMTGRKRPNSDDEYLTIEYNRAMDRILALEKELEGREDIEYTHLLNRVQALERVNAELQAVIIEYARHLSAERGQLTAFYIEDEEADWAVNYIMRNHGKGE